MQMWIAERAAVWRAGVRAPGNAQSASGQEERKVAAFPQTGAARKAHRKGTRLSPCRMGVAMSTTPQTVPEHPLVLEKHEDGVATLTLNRPEKLNALSTDLAVAFNETLGRIGADQNIHAVVLTGAARASCAGGDLPEIWRGRQENNVADLEPLLRAGMQAVLKIRTMRQPVIAP